MEKEIIVVEQRSVDFYGDQMTAVRLADGTVFVPIRPICDLIGVAWAPQYSRIKRDLILSEEQAVVTVTITTAGAVAQQTRQMVALPLKYLNGWLFGLNPSRVKAEIRDTLIRYQRECYDVLYEVFQENRVTARPDEMIDELLKGGSAEARAYQMAMAIANMAREQMLFKVQVEGRIGSAEARIDAIESALGNPDRQITQSQQMEVSQAVRAIGHELGKRSGRNEFGGVYGELYRRFEIASYKQLPTAKHTEAMSFLSDWYSKLTGTELPF